MRLRILILSLVAFMWLGSAVAHADSPELNTLATQLAGKPVTVECYTPEGEGGGFVFAVSRDDGVTWNMDSVIYLAGNSCGALQNVLTPGPRTAHWLRTFDGSTAVGYALLDITHEATHITLSSIDEGLVECTAVRNVWNSTKLLPLTWKLRQLVYKASVLCHEGMPTTGPDGQYRSVC